MYAYVELGTLIKCCSRLEFELLQAAVNDLE